MLRLVLFVFPVPAKDLLYVEGEYDYLRVIDVLGKEVLYSTYLESIDVSNYKNVKKTF